MNPDIVIAVRRIDRDHVIPDESVAIARILVEPPARFHFEDNALR